MQYKVIPAPMGIKAAGKRAPIVPSALALLALLALAPGAALAADGGVQLCGNVGYIGCCVDDTHSQYCLSGKLIKGTCSGAKPSCGWNKIGTTSNHAYACGITTDVDPSGKYKRLCTAIPDGGPVADPDWSVKNDKGTPKTEAGLKPDGGPKPTKDGAPWTTADGSTTATDGGPKPTTDGGTCSPKQTCPGGGWLQACVSVLGTCSAWFQTNKGNVSCASCQCTTAEAQKAASLCGGTTPIDAGGKRDAACAAPCGSGCCSSTQQCTDGVCGPRSTAPDAGIPDGLAQCSVPGDCPSAFICDLGRCVSCSTDARCGPTCAPCLANQFCDAAVAPPRCALKIGASQLGYGGGGQIGCACTVDDATPTAGSVLVLAILLLGAAIRCWRRRGIAVSIIVVSALASGSALGQARFNSERFLPAPGGQNLLSLYTARARDVRDFEFYLLASHSQAPLRGLRGDESVYDIVKYRETVNILATYGLMPRLDVGLALPVVVRQSGDGQPSGYGEFNAKSVEDNSAAVGDMRIIPKFTILDNTRGGLGLAAMTPITIPTGSQDAFLGSGAAGLEIRAAVDYRRGNLLLAANLGYHFSTDGEALNVRLGRELRYGVGALIPLVRDKIVLISELFGAINPTSGERSWSSRNFPTELLLVGRYLSAKGISAQVGGSVGLTDGVGTPQFRVIGKLGYSPGDSEENRQARLEPPPAPPPPPVAPPPPPDLVLLATQPKDGAKDVPPQTVLVLQFSEPVDPASVRGAIAAKDSPEATANVKTEIVVDRQTVKVKPASPAGWEAGTTVEVTLARSIASLRASGEAGRLVSAPVRISFEVAKPEVAPKVKVTEKRIEIYEPIYFEFGKDKILSVSYGLLNLVARAMKEHPEILVLEVAGHTDNVGGDDANLKLSRRRAEAVVKFIVGAGVGAQRLIPTGYGQRVPITTNDTEDGRAKNRRVEFSIIKKSGPASLPTGKPGEQP